MSWAIMITAFALLFVVWRKRKGAPWWLRTALVLIAGASLADTALGGWLAARLSDLLGLIPAPTPLLIGGATLVGLVYVVYELLDKKADKREMVVLAILPTLFLAGVGPLANTGTGLSDAVAQIGSNSIGHLIGG